MVENMVDEIKERYKLKEAAKIIAQNNIADTNKILNKLERAVRDGSLQVFQTSSNVHYEFGSDKGSGEIKESDLIRSDIDITNSALTWVDRQYDEKLHEAMQRLPDNLEAYWNDLNAWLEKNEQRIGTIFQDPDTSDTPFADKGGVVKGLTKHQVIVAFEGLHYKTDEKWSRALATPPEWLKTCRVMKGKKGNNKTSALWDPVQIAIALSEKHIPIKKLDTVFVNLEDWINKWHDASEIFR